MTVRIKLLQQVARTTEFGWQEDAIDEAILILRTLRNAKPALLRAAEGHIKGSTICDAVGLVLNPEEYERAKADAAALRALAEMGNSDG